MAEEDVQSQDKASKPAEKKASEQKTPEKDVKKESVAAKNNLENVPFDETTKKELKDTQDALQENHFVDAVYSVPVNVSVVLGQSKMPIERLVSLGRGAVVQLNKNVGDPVDIMVNDRLIAKGEVVMLDDTLGVSITELIKAGEN